MSQRDLGDPRFQEIVNELREKAPPAPEGLRERVRRPAQQAHERSAADGTRGCAAGWPLPQRARSRWGSAQR